MAILTLDLVLTAAKTGFCRVDSMCSSFYVSTFLRVGRPARDLDAELFSIFGIEPLPTLELHRLGPGDAPNGISAQKPIQSIESNVPPGRAHGDETAIDFVPKRQARAGTTSFELPSGI